LENSELNSEFVRISARWREAGQGISRACGEIPGAAEQGTQFVATRKQFGEISEFAELEQGVRE
jgi:hypothetical protein